MNSTPSSEKPDVPPAPRKLSIRFVPSVPLDVPVRPAEETPPRDHLDEVLNPKIKILAGERDGSHQALSHAVV